MLGCWLMTDIPKDIDKALWVELFGCEFGRHYLGYNPHTFHGRISAWCPKDGQWHKISKSEIANCSNEAKYWISGYLCGNEPSPPSPFVGDHDPDFRLWQSSILHFHKSGYWNSETRKCAECGCVLMNSWSKELCENCNPTGRFSAGRPTARR